MMLAPNTDACLTGVGSLPLGEDADPAKFIALMTPKAPFLPQFPKRGRFSQMVFEPFVGLEELFSPSGALTVQKGALSALLREVKNGALAPSPLVECWGHVCSAAKSEALLVKCQLAGPFTLGTQIQYLGAPLHSTPEGLELIYQAALRRAEEQLRIVSEQTELPAVIVFDEPVLPYLKKKDLLERSALVQIFQRLVRELSSRATVGLHCCGALEGEFFGVFWERLGIELLSIPLEYSQRLSKKLPPDWLRRFVSGGGSLVLGVVPVLHKSSTVTPVQMSKKFKDEEEELGMSLREILPRTMLSAYCGLGLLKHEEADANFVRLQEMQRVLHEAQ